MANFREIDEYLRKLYNNDKKYVRVFIVGDFNLAEAIWDSNHSFCSIEQEFLNSFSNLGLTQLVNDTTHILIYKGIH